MAEPGDPKPKDLDPPSPAAEPDHDDLIGFASPRALEGRERVIQPTFAPAPRPPEPPAPEPSPDPVPAPEAVQDDRPEPDLFAPPPLRPAPEPTPAPPLQAERPVAPTTPPLRPVPPRAATEPPARHDLDLPPEGDLRQPPRPFQPERAAAPVRREAAAIEGQGGLYGLYALILLIVPTVGVSGVIALLVAQGRAKPASAAALSHHVYQKRTLWIAALAAVAGVVLMVAPFALGPLTLFGVAVWVIVRGAVGLWRLKAGQVIADPRGLWI